MIRKTFLKLNHFLKDKFSLFCADNRGVFIILFAFCAAPLCLLTIGTLDLVLLISMKNQMDNAALVAIRAGQGNTTVTSDNIDQFCRQLFYFLEYNMLPYPVSPDAMVSFAEIQGTGPGHYVPSITYTENVVTDNTVPTGDSFGVLTSLCVQIEGYLPKSLMYTPFTNLIQNGNNSENNDDPSMIRISTGLQGSTYLPPVEIAIVIDTTTFVGSLDNGEPTRGGMCTALGLTFPLYGSFTNFTDYFNAQLKGRSIRFLLIPYGATINIDPSLFNSMENIQYLDYLQAPTNSKNASGNCFTEVWQLWDDWLPKTTIYTYQNYYYRQCLDKNGKTCIQDASGQPYYVYDNSFQKTYTAVPTPLNLKSPGTQPSSWINYNCPPQSISPFLSISDAFKSLSNETAFAFQKIQGRESQSKPLHHIGLLWCMRILGVQSELWSDTLISSQDSRTKKIVFLVGGDAPLRQVPLTNLWTANDLVYDPNSTTYSSWASQTTVNIDDYSAYGYTYEIDKNFMSSISSALDIESNSVMFSSDQYKNAVNNLNSINPFPSVPNPPLATVEAISMLQVVCEKITETPNVSLYSVYYDIDLSANSTLSNPGEFRIAYQRVIKNYCNSNPIWAKNNSVIQSDQADTQFPATLMSALDDSGVFNSAAYTITQL